MNVPRRAVQSRQTIMSTVYEVRTAWRRTRGEHHLLRNGVAREPIFRFAYSILIIPMSQSQPQSQSQSQSQSQAQQAVIDFLDYRAPGSRPGDIHELERWWVDRQVALEQAGYMLRSRYRPGWKPSWAGTKKFYFYCEDGQSVGVSVTILLPIYSCL
jgi:hypothetical protein